MTLLSARRKAPDAQLEDELSQVRHYTRSIRLNQGGVCCWGALLLVASMAALAAPFAPRLAPTLGLGLALAVVLAGVGAIILSLRARNAPDDAVDRVSETYPDVASALRAAAAQQASETGEYHFLQQRVIRQALDHARQHDWVGPFRERARKWLIAHVLVGTAAFGLSLAFVIQHPRTAATAHVEAANLDVTPGTVEVERGSTLLIAARFGADIPRRAELVWKPEDSDVQRRPMERSLSDPVFAVGLPQIVRNGTYWIEYDAGESARYQISVFDRPALQQANAELTYPEYTQLRSRRVPDTRRVSAVVGTRIRYEFLTNKPLAVAELRRSDGTSVTLEPSGDAQFVWEATLSRNERFRLHLEDAAGRTPLLPIEVWVDTTPNRRPDLKLRFPGSDIRVSPLQELTLEAEARDDFGLQDSGLAFSIGEEEPRYISLAPPPPTLSRDANLSYLLALESHGAQPNQVVTWFAWADDFGPDGEIRRSTSDLAFADVRALDEILRENATGSPSSNGAGGGAGDELLDTQRQLSIAIWKMRERDAKSSEYSTDVATLRDAQLRAREQLQELRGTLESADQQVAGAQADSLMERAANRLTESTEGNTTALGAAWTAAQGAYQKLLQLQPRETQVAQSSSSRGGNGRRGERELDELEFRHEDDRYATETQAQAPPTAEEREQLALLARLRELARRQQHVNERLQELQTALAAAADEQQREEIRRELKRLEEEQRQMLTDMDEARQRADRMPSGERSEQARQQLETSREAMQRASEQLQQENVSQALAAGTRAQENLQQTSEGLRNQSAGRFDEQMRTARQQARELAESQRALQESLDQLSQGQQQLDDSAERRELADTMDEQQLRHQALLEQLREVAEVSEAAEPQLHRQLYDTLRQEDSSRTAQQLEQSAELLRRGFTDAVRESQEQLARQFDRLQQRVERAAEAVLGDERSELQFAQNELAELSRELERERGESPSPETGAGSGGEATQPGEAGAEQAGFEQLIQRAGASGAGQAEGPLSGRGFADWAERLRTVEALVEDPTLRQRLAQARFEAEEMRRSFVRQGTAPQWDLVNASIVAPLQDARAWLQQELRRRTDPEALQPIDRDPVPERYTEAVQNYYEALAED